MSHHFPEKVEACKQAGIVLIVIPYWWDQLYDSFLATVHKYRPDLVPNPPVDANPVSEIQPTRKLRETEYEELTLQE